MTIIAGNEGSVQKDVHLLHKNLLKIRNYYIDEENINEGFHWNLTHKLEVVFPVLNNRILRKTTEL